jgi:hypothetical protein
MSEVERWTADANLSLWMMRKEKMVVGLQRASFIYARESSLWTVGRGCPPEQGGSTANQATHALPSRPGTGHPGGLRQSREDRGRRGSPPWLLDRDRPPSRHRGQGNGASFVPEGQSGGAGVAPDEVRPCV